MADTLQRLHKDGQRPKDVEIVKKIYEQNRNLNKEIENLKKIWS